MKQPQDYPQPQQKQFNEWVRQTLFNQEEAIKQIYKLLMDLKQISDKEILRQSGILHGETSGETDSNDARSPL